MKETTNYTLLGRELRLSDQLLYSGAVGCFESAHKHTKGIQDWPMHTYELSRSRPQEIIAIDTKEPPSFKLGNPVSMVSRHQVTGVYQATIYIIKRNGQCSTQSEHRLKILQYCNNIIYSCDQY